MGYKFIDENTLINIADVIREKTETTERIQGKDFANAINNISTGSPFMKNNAVAFEEGTIYIGDKVLVDFGNTNNKGGRWIEDLAARMNQELNWEFNNIVFSNKITNFYKAFSQEAPSNFGWSYFNMKPFWCGDGIIDMSWAFANRSYSVYSPPVCGPNVINMQGTYYNCYSIGAPWEGTAPACGPKVEDFSLCYVGCQNLSGEPVCGDNVINMSNTYNYCTRISGNAACGNNVINMSYAYNFCENLSGSPACGPKVEDFSGAYNFCRILVGPPICGPNVINMAYAYNYCTNLKGAPQIGRKVVNASCAYSYCYQISGSPVCPDSVENFANTYCYCQQLVGKPVCGKNVINMSGAYTSCKQLTGSPQIGENVKNASYAYSGCVQLTGSPICPESIEGNGFVGTYSDCTQLTGKGICGTSVTSMSATYANTKITECEIGPRVTDISYAFMNTLITNIPTIPPTITDSFYTFADCTLLQGEALIPETGLNMSGMYSNCPNVFFNNNIIISSRAYSVSHLFDGVPNVQGNFFFLGGYDSNSLNDSAISYMFQGRDNKNQLNIFVKNDSPWNAALYTGKMCNPTLAWATSDNCYFNSKENIYVYYNATLNNTDDFSFAYYKKTANIQETYIPGVRKMYKSYAESSSTTGYPVCGDEVIDLVKAYANCSSITGSAVCGDLVPNLCCTYYQCSSLDGDAACGNNVIDMAEAYYGCNKLQGNAPCGPKVENMYSTYCGCLNLKGWGQIGINVRNLASAFLSSGITQLLTNDEDYLYLENMDHAFTNCHNMVGKAICGPNVQNMCQTYLGCWNLIESPKCGDKVNNMYETYSACTNITGDAVCGNNVVNMAYTYRDCIKLNGSPACGPNVQNMLETYFDCYSLTGEPACGDNVKCFHRTYYNCSNLTGNPVVGPLVNDMYQAYYGCSNLTGSPVCPSYLVNFTDTYCDCENLTGLAVFPNSGRSTPWNTYQHCKSLEGIVNLGDCYSLPYTFYGCEGLTEAKCSDNVTQMMGTYAYCTNLREPVCGNYVTTLTNTYKNCSNLEYAYVGPNVSNMSYAYSNCDNITEIRIDGPAPYMIGSFDGCKNITTPVFSSGLVTASRAYANCPSIEVPIIPDVSADLSYLYYNCGGIKTAVNTPQNVINIYGMFMNCKNLITPALSNYVKYANCMYANCNSLTSIAMTDNLMYASHMYENCFSLACEPKVSNNVIDCSYMYCNCYELIGSPVVPNSATKTDYMYYNCSKLTGSPIITNNFSHGMYAECTNISLPLKIKEGVTQLSGENMFKNCINLKGNCILNNIWNIGYGTFIGCSNLNYIIIDKQQASGYYISQNAFYNCINANIGLINYSTGTTQDYFGPNCFKDVPHVCYDNTQRDLTSTGALSWGPHEGENEVVVQPTCEEDGYKEAYECKYCKHHFDRIVYQKLGHSPTDTSGETSTCIRCGKPMKKQEATVIKEWTIKNSSPYYFAKQASPANTYKSNNYHKKSSTAKTTFTINLESNQTIPCTYTVSSESNYDWLIIKVNGAQICKVAGNITNTVQLNLNKGNNTVEVSYSKDSSTDSGNDCATITLSPVTDKGYEWVIDE